MKIPQYAQRVPRHKLVKVLCRGSCDCLRYAELSKLQWSKLGPNTDPELFATCLMCGYKAKDKYNWINI